MTMRILVVEDDRKDLEAFREKLVNAGYDVEWATTGEDALQFVCLNPIDGAVVDLVLKDAKYGGMRFIRECRKKGFYFPVLVVTDRNIESTRDEVNRLYGTSPFDYVEDYLEKRRGRGSDYLWEMCDRLRNMITPLQFFDFPPYRFDRREKQFYRDGKPFDLKPRDGRVLEYLINHRRIVSHKEIYELEHKDHYVDDTELENLSDQQKWEDHKKMQSKQRNLVQQRIGKLRKKLDPDAKLNLIHEEQGEGYRFRRPPLQPRPMSGKDTLVVGQYQLQVDNCDLIVLGDDARVIELTPLECQILEVLMRRAGVMTSRVLVHERVYGLENTTPLTKVDEYLLTLRDKVNSGKPGPIKYQDDTGYYWFSCS